MNRRIAGASFLYTEPAGPLGAPARWLRTAATIVDAWGSSLCARQWHASRLVVTGRPVMAHAVIGHAVMAQLLDARVPVERAREN